jgi:hypothetical protein
MIISSAEEPGPKLTEYLSRFRGDMIPIGFGMMAELKWMTHEYPQFAKLFTEWYDLQKLVAQRYAQILPANVPLSTEYLVPGLMSALKKVGFRG